MSDVVLRTEPDIPPRVALTKAAPRPAIATAALWMRRTHLYSGLLMLPFVLIYGVSAFLFNHAGGEPPLALPESEAMRGQWSFDADALAASIVDHFAWPARTVAAAHGEGDWAFEFREADATWRLTLPLGDRPATLRRVRASSPEERVPMSLFAAQGAAAERAAAALLAASGRSATELRRLGAPTVRFDGPNGERTVSLQRGQVSRSASAFDLERLLMRLHTTHGYATSHWARTVWAVIVDLMAAAMLLWTVSGVWMWWLKRSHRRSGGFVLLGGVAAAVLLGAALALQFG